MKIGSLFSGAGALDLAALELFPGSTVAWHSEIDPAASKVLAYRFPEVPNLGSVTDVDWASIEPVDVIIGGFPCQDVSSAGRRAGLAVGTRSGLWSYMAKAIAVLKPRYVLIENVEGLLSASAVRELESGSDDLGDSGSGPVLRAAGAVCGDLASLGYDTSWTCLRACEVGACHRRSRVFILAHVADTNSGEVRQQPEPESRRGSASIAGFASKAASDTEGDGRARFDDGTSGAPARRGRERDVAGSSGSRSVPVTLLPTPQAVDGLGGKAAKEVGGRRPSGAKRAVGLPDVIRHHLLPTPTARLGDPNSRGASHPDRRNSLQTKRSGELDEVAVHVVRTSWGVYGAAVARQESFTRPAPSPTEPNSKGRPRLAAPFPEWMMAWPSGWVTDPAIGLTRAEQLKCIGNGVITIQAVPAFRYLFSLESLEVSL